MEVAIAISAALYPFLGNAYYIIQLKQKFDQLSGERRSVTDVCDTFSITRMVLSKTLDMLDHTPEEISAILRETY